jgi:hypothetical protein
VIIFTTALFLSGYVLQQRTLRDLRAAIREPAKPQPVTFLPDRFKYSTTELSDGTVVAIEPEPGFQAPKQSNEQQVVVEVRPTGPQEVEPARRGRLDDVMESPRADSGKVKNAKSKKGKKEEKKPKRETAAQRRRRIKEEIRKMSHDSRPMLYQRRLW